MASASITNMDMGFARLSLHNQSFSSSDLVIPELKLSGYSIFSDQDLLTLILVRVPLKKVTQFKCVSKSWFFLINSPYFSNLRSMLPLPPPFGLLFQSSLVGNGNRFGRFKVDPVYYFPVQDGYNDNHHHKAPVFCRDLLGHPGYPTRILDCSHGLLLCSTSFWAPMTQRENYIYNPITNELVTLPRPSDQSMICSASMVLAFHPSYSPHYKIIACAAIHQNIPDRDYVHFIRQFEIYSSETRSWRVSGQPFTTPIGPKFRDAVYCNGSVYYLDELKSEDCQYFNLEDERLHTFPRPPIATIRSLRRDFYFGQSDDHLHFVEVCRYATVLHVYEMNCDHSGWFVKYQVDLAPLCKTFPQFDGEYLVSVLSIARRDKFQEDDSFLVLATLDKVVSYNLVNTSLKKMFDIREVFYRKVTPLLKYYEFKVWQYAEGHLSA